MGSHTYVHFQRYIIIGQTKAGYFMSRTFSRVPVPDFLRLGLYRITYTEKLMSKKNFRTFLSKLDFGKVQIRVLTSCTCSPPLPMMTLWWILSMSTESVIWLSKLSTLSLIMATEAATQEAGPLTVTWSLTNSPSSLGARGKEIYTRVTSCSRQKK